MERTKTVIEFLGSQGSGERSVLGAVTQMRSDRHGDPAAGVGVASGWRPGCSPALPAHPCIRTAPQGASEGGQTSSFLPRMQRHGEERGAILRNPPAAGRGPRSESPQASSPSLQTLFKAQ